MKQLIAIIALTMLFSCSKQGEPISAGNELSYFGIHFLQNGSITEQEVRKMDINSLVLDKPWLTYNDIEFYDFSTHCIYLKKDKSHFFENYGGKYYQFPDGLVSKPFVVVAGVERCYVGALYSVRFTLGRLRPHLTEMDVGFYPDDVIHISKSDADGEDIRNHPLIAEMLTKQGLYHAGLALELTAFQLITNSDTATVEYSIKIINNDQDDLYIIDPDKMGSESFHYYTNGPNLWDTSKPGQPIYLFSKYKKTNPPEPSDSWNFDWFVLIKSKQALERTIRLKGYPHIPNGTFSGYMYLENPKYIAKNKRNVSNSRIWIGEIKSNDLKIVVQDN